MEAKRWLENQTGQTLAPVHTQAKRLRDEMNLQILALTDVSNMLLDVSNKEIEKRNMKVYNRARALNKLARLFIDRYKKVVPPEQVSYDSINKYAAEVQKVLPSYRYRCEELVPPHLTLLHHGPTKILGHLRESPPNIQRPIRVRKQRIRQNQNHGRSPPTTKRVADR